jgi:hypothetical protein
MTTYLCCIYSMHFFNLRVWRLTIFGGWLHLFNALPFHRFLKHYFHVAFAQCTSLVHQNNTNCQDKLLSHLRNAPNLICFPSFPTKGLHLCNALHPANNLLHFCNALSSSCVFQRTVHNTLHLFDALFKSQTLRFFSALFECPPNVALIQRTAFDRFILWPTVFCCIFSMHF